MTTIVNRPQIQLPISRQYSEAISECADGNVRVPSHDPTPLIGRWADESFPLNSRQASEMITAIATADAPVQRQRSSIVFQDDQGNEFAFAEDADPETASQVEIDDKHSQERNSELAEAHSTDDMYLDSPTHVSRCYKYDPYNLNAGVDIIYCCYCDQCVALLHGGMPAVSPSNLSMVSAQQSVASALPPVEPQPQPAHPTSHAPRPLGVSPDSHNTSFAQPMQDEWDAPRPAYPAPVQHQAPAAAPRGFATHLNARSAPTTVPAVTMANRQAQGPQLSSFMPPPPPPRIMTLVLEEEGNRAASSVFFHVLTRWYNHVIEAQEFFVLPEDYCPPPNKELYPFDEWADRVSGWWYTHFEHRQKKPTRFAAPFPQGGARGYGPM